ncbi:MAG TPA: TonB-dependent receptor plug domain-containing protein, partial [Flavisolibacter sp.]
INGNMRDGVLIEKQKARVAYENVIRRQVDPGLLEMTAANSYRIRVYPVPAHGKRQISFTVQQLLLPNGQQMDYVFPVNFANRIKKLATEIAVTNSEMPFTTKGLLEGQIFSQGHSKQLVYRTQDVPINSLLLFSIPLQGSRSICRFADDCNQFFVGRIIPDSVTLSKRSPQSVTVFWDVSASAESRSTAKEISFLEAYLKEYNPEQVTVVTFAIDVLEVKQFRSPSRNFNTLKRFLEAQKADGGTRLNRLDCAIYPADEYLLFTDGQNTFGDGAIQTNGKPVFCIQSSLSANTSLLMQIAKSTAGKLVNLSLLDTKQAIFDLGQPQWKLTVSERDKEAFDLQWIETGNAFSITGTNKEDADSLVLNFEYADQKQEAVLYLKRTDCNDAELSSAALMMEWHAKRKVISNEDSLHASAISFNAVSTTTSLIVLDALEDYHQFGINPPQDLRPEFKKRYPPLPDKRQEKQKEQEILVYQKLKQAVEEYNKKIKWWNPNLASLALQPLTEKPMQSIAANDDAKTVPQPKDGQALSKGKALSEVVVVGYGSQRRRSLTSATSTVSGSQLSTAGNVQSALQGRVAGLVVNGSGPGASSGITLRGAASIRGGGEPLYVLDGMRIDAATAMNMSTFDIQNISVLKDASAAAIYGSGAASGVIVITTKRGQFAQPIKKQMEEELTDSLQEVEPLLRYSRYLEMKDRYKDIPSFYF